jgi:hypothetical protein
MENNFNDIERFFNGAMDAKETAEFETRRANDKEFARDFLLYRQANEVVRLGARQRLKKHLDELGQSEMAVTMISTYGRYYLLRKYWYAIAATVVILIGLGYFTYHSIHPGKSIPTLAQLFDSYYEVPKADLAMVRGDHAEEPLSLAWNSAIQQYSEGQYNIAAEDFRVLLANSEFTHRSVANFYLGICYLNTNLPDSAITHFSSISPTSSLNQDASWYLALSYLKTNNLKRASEVFKNIATSKKHYKKEQAEEILDLLPETD